MKQKNFQLDKQYALNYYRVLKNKGLQNVHCGRNPKTGHWIVSWNV